MEAFATEVLAHSKRQKELFGKLKFRIKIQFLFQLFQTTSRFIKLVSDFHANLNECWFLVAVMNWIASISRALLKKENILLTYRLHELRSENVKSRTIKLCIHEILLRFEKCKYCVLMFWFIFRVGFRSFPALRGKLLIKLVLLRFMKHSCVLGSSLCT